MSRMLVSSPPGVSSCRMSSCRTRFSAVASDFKKKLLVAGPMASRISISVHRTGSGAPGILCVTDRAHQRQYEPEKSPLHEPLAWAASSACAISWAPSHARAICRGPRLSRILAQASSGRAR